MKSKSFLFLLACTSFTAAAYAGPVSSSSAPVSVSDAEVSAVIHKLETSGALNAAVDQGIQRFVANMQKQQAAQQEQAAKQQEAAEAAIAHKIAKVNLEKDHVFGPKNAEITLVEYSDPECPFCKKFADVPENIVKKYNGKVNYVWRFFPLPMHGPKAIQESVAAECAAEQGGNAKFFPMLMSILHTTNSNGEGMPGADPITALATSQGLNMPEFKRCMSGKKALAAVNASMKEGDEAGVTGTPTTVILNNLTGKSKVNIGWAPQANIEAMVNELMSK
jgi:protein-disulfide isomerase